MNLRLRLVFTIALTTAATLGLAFAVVFLAYTRTQEHQLDDLVTTVARNEAAEAPQNGFRFSTRPGPASSDVGPLETFGIIYDESGGVLTATEPFDKSPPPRASIEHPTGTPFDLRVGSTNLRATIAPIPGHPGKIVLIATSRDDLDSDRVSLAKGIILVLVVAVPWTSFIAFWLGGRMTRGHDAIARVARAVASGDLTARVASKDPDPEIARLASDVDHMVDRIAELVTTQERFVANAAHELRSPLAALSGELQQALRKERDAEAYRAAIKTALESARRLKEVADDLLAIAGARNDATIPREPIEIGTVIDGARALVKPTATERGIEIEVDGELSAEVEHANQDLTRLVRNLLENAVRHSPDGGKVSVRVRAAELVRVEVHDDGDGVPPSDRERVFEPFHRGARKRHSQRGTGLGLPIAREIARVHDGDVTLAVGAGKGATFIVELPRKMQLRTSPSR